MNSLSKANDLAIKAIEFAVICNLTESCSPSTYKQTNNKNQSTDQNFKVIRNKPPLKFPTII